MGGALRDDTKNGCEGDYHSISTQNIFITITVAGGHKFSEIQLFSEVLGRNFPRFLRIIYYQLVHRRHMNYNAQIFREDSFAAYAI